nr:S1 RNA-binding domain-containing protein [Treponema sp.]
MEKLEIGQQIETEIVAIGIDTIFLDLNAKSEGVLSRAELADENGNLSVKEGDKIKVFFLGYKNDEARFTTKISGQSADNSMIENAWRSGIPVEGVVEKEIKGGYEVKIGGARAFCPYSQMGGRKRDEQVDFTGRHLVFKIQEYKNDGKNIVVSNRAILDEQRAQNLSNLESQIAVGSMVTGKITALHSYGAFVDLGGFQALLPVSEISRARVDDIEKVLSVGQEITAKVIKADWKSERVSVSLKALEADPWDKVEDKYSEGDKIDGTIARIADFGVFVNLEPGIDGLVHVSELD